MDQAYVTLITNQETALSHVLQLLRNSCKILMKGVFT